MDSLGSKGSGSDEEPLVPDDFDDDFYIELKQKVPLITKALRQKDTQENADNVQRLLIISSRYKSDLKIKHTHNEELKAEIINLKEQLDQSAKLSRLDRDTISELRNVIENAWRQKDAAQIREQDAQEELLRLREKVETLEETVAKLSDKKQILQDRREELKEREHLKSEIKDLNKRLQLQRSYLAEMETSTQALEKKNKDLVKILDETSSEAYNLRKKNDTLVRQVNESKAEENRCSEQAAQFKTKSERLTKLKVRQNLQILSLKTNLEHLHSQYNVNSNKLAKLTVELEYAIQDRDRN